MKNMISDKDFCAEIQLSGKDAQTRRTLLAQNK